MIHRWDDLTFLHWAYEPEVVQALLPEGLTVDTFDGMAWVGLVPFQMTVRPPRLPGLAWVSYFWETNVRTYATRSDGASGVWFMSLDASRLHAVLGGRVGYRLPYFWSKMSLKIDDDVITYRCDRRWPEPSNAASLVSVRRGAPFEPSELGEFDHFLTAKWLLHSATKRGLRTALAEHPVWPLHRVEVLEVDDGLIAAAGLPQPSGDPVAHGSHGVEVRIGFPTRRYQPL